MNNYSNTEKSLKRWLKTRVKVTMATVVGFLIAGTVSMGADTLNITEVEKYEILSSGLKSGNPYIGLTVKKYEDIAVKDKIKEKTITENINLNLNGNYTDVTINAIHLESNIDKDSNEINDKRINYQEKLNLLGNNIDLTLINSANTNTNGIMNANGGILNLGNENSVININVTNIADNITGQVVGISTTGNTDRTYANNAGKGVIGGKTTVNGRELNIKAVSNNANLLVGISVNNETTHNSETVEKETMSRMDINAEKTKIELENKNGKYATALAVYSNGILNVNGDLEITVKDGEVLQERTAIGVRGNSITKINADGKHTVKLDGNILFDHSSANTNSEGETDLTVNLSNSDSFLKGKIYKSTVGTNLDYTDGHGMKLGLSNGGTWHVTGDSFVNDLTLDGGVINILKQDAVTLAEDNGTSVKIDSLHGNGGSVTYETTITGNNVTVAKGGLEVGGTDGKTALKVGFSGVDADDLAKTGNVSEAFKALQDNAKITGKDGEDMTDTVVDSYFAEEGKVSGEITAVAGKDGKLAISQAEESHTVMALKDLASINYLSWKQEMSSLSQRMGELRDSSAEHGVWARVYGGKVENGSQYDNEYQTYQVGYDKKYSVDNGKVYLGYLISYTDGETNYELGSGENDSIGAGIYATWMNNNGHYVDVLYKVSRLNNKFDVGSTNDKVGRSKGDYDTYGISLSAEYGKRFDIAEKWFAEPSVGMHLGRLGEESYTTNGIGVSQDSIYTAEGRIGTSLGYKFNDNGNVYVRTHVVKEFAGDIDAEYTADGFTRETSEDFGDTWFEFGIGANYRFGENVNVYADIEKTGDSTVDTEWQGNLGFRYEF